MSNPSKRLSLDGLIAVKGSAAPTIKAAPMPALDTNPGEESLPSPTLVAAPPIAVAQSAPALEENLVPLNFRVPATFKRKFKTYAASHDMFLTDLLKVSFEAYEREQGA
jgi:hypothetical protein